MSHFSFPPRFCVPILVVDDRSVILDGDRRNVHAGRVTLVTGEGAEHSPHTLTDGALCKL